MANKKGLYQMECVVFNADSLCGFCRVVAGWGESGALEAYSSCSNERGEVWRLVHGMGEWIDVLTLL
jgi:hypothetical protein